MLKWWTFLDLYFLTFSIPHPASISFPLSIFLVGRKTIVVALFALKYGFYWFYISEIYDKEAKKKKRSRKKNLNNGKLMFECNVNVAPTDQPNKIVSRMVWMGLALKQPISKSIQWKVMMSHVICPIEVFEKDEKKRERNRTKNIYHIFFNKSRRRRMEKKNILWGFFFFF